MERAAELEYVRVVLCRDRVGVYWCCAGVLYLVEECVGTKHMKNTGVHARRGCYAVETPNTHTERDVCILRTEVVMQSRKVLLREER